MMEDPIAEGVGDEEEEEESEDELIIRRLIYMMSLPHELNENVEYLMKWIQVLL